MIRGEGGVGERNGVIQRGNSSGDHPGGQRDLRPQALGAGRVPGLDGIRGFAVILVILSHAHMPFAGAGGIGGVTTFFVLSGFLITGLLLKEHRTTGRIDLLAFWGRRALRLLPALVVFVGFMGLVYATLGWATRFQLVGAIRPVLLYYGNFHIAFGGKLDPFRHTWSLAVEEQFYLVWPLLLGAILILFRGRRTRLPILLTSLVLLTLVSVGWRLYQGIYLGDPNVRWFPHTTVFSMTAGAVLAVLFDRGWRPGRWALPVGLFALSVYYWYPEIFPLYATWVSGPVVYTVSSLGLIVSVLGTQITPFAWGPLRSVGKISYGWYLWHFPVMYTVLTNPDSVTHLRIAVALVVVLSLGAAALSWRYLEEPVQRRFRHRLERVRLAGPVQAPDAVTSSSPSAEPAPPTADPENEVVIDLTRSQAGSAEPVPVGDGPIDR